MSSTASKGNQLGPTASEQVYTSSASLLEKVGLTSHPTAFGLPDLLEENLTREEQNQRLKICIEENLSITKDGRRIKIVLIPEMLNFIADMFLYGLACTIPIEETANIPINRNETSKIFLFISSPPSLVVLEGEVVPPVKYRLQPKI